MPTVHFLSLRKQVECPFIVGTEDPVTVPQSPELLVTGFVLSLSLSLLSPCLCVCLWVELNESSSLWLHAPVEINPLSQMISSGSHYLRWWLRVNTCYLSLSAYITLVFML